MTNKPVFVAFEGLDGSGKSTCARLVAESLDAVLLTTPSPGVRAFRDALLEELGPSQEARQLFYLATVFAASAEAQRLLASGRSVVIDRYLLSTNAYAAFRASALRLDELSAALFPADVTVFLDVPLDIRRSRIAGRGASSFDLETISDAADRRLRHEHFTRHELPVVGRFEHVAATHETPDGIARRIVGLLDERRRQR